MSGNSKENQWRGKRMPKGDSSCALRSGFWEEFNKEWDAINRSTLIVRGDDSVDMSAYKVYINRNIHGTGARFRHLAPPNSVYTRLQAGAYAVVVREYDATKVDRMESNTLQLQIRDDEQVIIWVSLRDGRILIALDEKPEHGRS